MREEIRSTGYSSWSENDYGSEDNATLRHRQEVYEQVAAQLRDTAAEFEVDEIMIHPICGARPGDPADSWPARLHAFELLAGALL